MNQLYKSMQYTMRHGKSTPNQNALIHMFACDRLEIKKLQKSSLMPMPGYMDQYQDVE